MRHTLLPLLLLAACGGREVIRNPATLEVGFTWTMADRCTPRSPEIRVGGLPPATQRLAVTMTDLNVPTFPHGGGEVAAPPGGTIPAGALTGYAGPCPPGAPHPYRIAVDAVDAQNRIIARGSATRSFPP